MIKNKIIHTLVIFVSHAMDSEYLGEYMAGRSLHPQRLLRKEDYIVRCIVKEIDNEFT